MKKIFIFSLLSIFSLLALAIDGEALAKQYNLSANKKAMKQWERVFKKKRKMKRLGIYDLSDEEKRVLKEYLIRYAADSDQPAAAGL